MATLVLDSTTKTIKAVMSGAAATSNPEFVVSWADSTSSSLTEGSSDGVLNGTTPVTLVAAPASSTRRVIKSISIQNKDSASVTLTISYDNNGTARQLAKVTLAENDTWTTDGVYDTNGNLKTSASGAGTVTTVSVASANGFAGTVANATSTPAITLSTSITGVLKGNGTAISAATSGTDYLAPPSGTAILKANSGGALANATAGTDYAAATTGTNAQLLANDGSGGFSNVTVGTGLSLSSGTLSATGSGFGTVTSVDVSGGTTGLTTSGGPITNSGTITLSGTLAVTNGGTGLTSAATNGQLLIGNGTGFTLSTLTAGSGISVTNSSGAITITNTGGGGGGGGTNLDGGLPDSSYLAVDPIDGGTP